MNIDDEEIFNKKNYKCEQPVLDNLNIVYNSSNAKIVLWNKYQIFDYEDFEFKSPEKIFIPEFQIHRVIASNNYLVCLDCNGNVHLTLLKFKNSTQKNSKIAFQPREQGIKAWIRYKEDHILSLKYDADTYFLCLHRINSDFRLKKKIILLCNTEHWPLEQNTKEKYILTIHTINEDNFEHLKKIFKTEENIRNIPDLMVLTLDKCTVYGFLFSPKMIDNETTLLKLYTCPAEICNMEIVDSVELYLLIGLTMGTIIKLSLNDISKSPDIVHLNTALYKLLPLKDSLIYSDGVTMWKSENTFSNDIKLTQFFVRNTNDFVKCGDQIICTTFTKLIYKFSFEDKSAYLNPIFPEYCPAENLLNNSEYIDKLFEEIDKNNDLVKKITSEQDYITALSLSNRQDVVNQAIDSNIVVFERYDEVSNIEFTLTEKMKEYFEADTWLFLVKITNSSIFDTLNNILSHLWDSIRIQIMLSSTKRILKTTCIKIEDPLKTVSFMIPLKMRNVHPEINASIKIVVSIPAALDKTKKTLSVLYRKDIVLTSEHFIKTNRKTLTNSLKKPKESIKDLIQKTATNQHGSIFQFTDASKLKESETHWSFYVKLPNDYEQNFQTDNYCKKYLNCTKTNSLIQQWSTEEFLKSKSHIILVIGNERLKINIQNDGFSSPLLKVSGANARMAFNIRNFFSNMIYNDYESHEPGKEFISYSLYTTTENLQKAVKNCITSSATSEDFLQLMDQFEKHIIGALPL